MTGSASASAAAATPEAETHDVAAVIIGAGVVGLAIAAALAEAGFDTIVLEKNQKFGEEASSRNSEVVHAGLYYPPGGLKGRLCVEGRDRLYAYCAAHGVPHARLGKLIVATSEQETAALEAVLASARANGVEALDLIAGRDAQAREPALRAEAALWSPLTGVVDSHALMLSLLGRAEAAGAAVAFGAPAARIRPETKALLVEVGGAAPARLRARIVVNAAGLWAQSVARRVDGLAPEQVPPSVFYKGSYFALSGMRAPFRHLIYPAPVAGGLGVHLTLDLAGAARFGPDAEPLETSDPAAIDYSVDPARGAAFYAAIRRYWPGLPDGALRPDYAGVRAKYAADRRADFRIDAPEAHGVRGLYNLFGFESPGLTASLAIGAHMAALIRAETS